MELKDAIYARRAIRSFTAEPISQKVIRELIEAAIQAPSAVTYSLGPSALSATKGCWPRYRGKPKHTW